MSQEVECSLCGRDGGPYVGCPKGCNGRPQFAQPKGYTLSDHRAGRAPKEDRTGEEGPLGPKKADPMWTIGTS